MKTAKCPYKVPPFDPGPFPTLSVYYYWWSWHPRYPYWSKSCLGGSSVHQAWEALNKPLASSIKIYHNKLIREGDGKFTEVADMPCQKMYIWRQIARQARRETDAKPLKCLMDKPKHKVQQKHRCRPPTGLPLFDNRPGAERRLPCPRLSLPTPL